MKKFHYNSYEITLSIMYTIHNNRACQILFQNKLKFCFNTYFFFFPQLQNLFGLALQTRMITPSTSRKQCTKRK